MRRHYRWGSGTRLRGMTWSLWDMIVCRAARWRWWHSVVERHRGAVGLPWRQSHSRCVRSYWWCSRRFSCARSVRGRSSGPGLHGRTTRWMSAIRSTHVSLHTHRKYTEFIMLTVIVISYRTTDYQKCQLKYKLYTAHSRGILYIAQNAPVLKKIFFSSLHNTW